MKWKTLGNTWIREFLMGEAASVPIGLPSFPHEKMTGKIKKSQNFHLYSKIKKE